MSDKFFREGGPHNIRRTGRDQIEMRISIPQDSDGLVGRSCPDKECSPGYFKVKGGTGITEGHIEAFCPYCRYSAKPGEFITQEQRRYGKDHVVREAHEAVQRMFKDAFKIGPSNRRSLGGGSSISYKPGRVPTIRRPAEEQVERNVVCQHCRLKHSVYGLATWCPDCGIDIFLTHVDAELTVIKVMLGDISRRREALGPRIAAKDLENCLEDTVSIFEAVLKIIARNLMKEKEVLDDEIDRLFRQMGSGFQSIRRTKDFLSKNLQLSDFPGLSHEDADVLFRIFEKRHPIAHNLGVIDRSYIEKVASNETEGREIDVSIEEVGQAIDMIQRVFGALK